MDDIIETKEEIMPEPYHVYVQTDKKGRITAVNSSAFVSADWGTEIDQGYGDKYHHAQGNYFPQRIYTEDGIPRYKLEDGQAVERTEEEIAADRAALPEPEPSDTDVLNTLLGVNAAEQLRRALQLYANTLTEAQALEVAAVYPAWAAGRSYAVGDILRHGVNSVGDPQLYRVVQAHTSQAEWLPGQGTDSLYDAIGLDGGGYPIWSQPSGAHDAYNKGDIVSYNGTLYRSLIDGNTWSPDAYPDGWEVYTG